MRVFFLRATTQSGRASRELRLLIALPACILAFYGLAGYFATSQVIGEHHEWRAWIARPEDYGLKPETVSFLSTDGTPLKAWWLHAGETPRGSLILAHGRDGNRSHMLSRAAFLVRNGYNVLAVDLRDHGESGGRFITSGYLESRDILGAVQFLRPRDARTRIAVLGHSYGAVAALTAGADSPDIAAVISDGAFASSDEMLSNVTNHYLQSRSTPLWGKALLRLSKVPGVYTATVCMFYLLTGVYFSEATTTVMPWVARLQKPVLFIAGESDFISPVENARRMFATAPTQRKELFVVPGAGHNTTYRTAPAAYERAVLSFLDTALERSHTGSRRVARRSPGHTLCSKVLDRSALAC